MKLHFLFSEDADVQQGLARVLPLLSGEQGDDGVPVRVSRGEQFAVSREADTGRIVYTNRVEIFRGLSMLVQHWQEGDFCIQQQRRFESCGIMIDCSRGAVPKPETIEQFQCCMALMGANLLMLYTEDTYEVPERPYFGYLRGRYTQEELHRMDESAWQLGIEMVPCIQTLAHLERALQWYRQFVDVRDTDSVLYVGRPETCQFLEQMIHSASAPFRSRRIHIGMDEAFGLGLGHRLQEKGFAPAGELMKTHLGEVCRILDKLGLEAMMWSDMFFHACSPSDMAYAPGTVLTEQILQQIPASVEQVYWHYYSEDEDTYREFLDQHHRMGSKTAFAGAVWSWNGHATDYRKAFHVAPAALRQCEKHGIEEVFITAWMDDGAESNIRSLLLGVQMYCEYNYMGSVDMQHLEERFRICADASAESFYNISKLNVVPGLPLQKAATTSVIKNLLYEDPLMPILEADFGDLLDGTYFTDLARLYGEYARDYPTYDKMFRYYQELAKTAALKCDWHNQAAGIVRRKETGRIPELCSLAEELIRQLLSLSDAWRELWYWDNKPFGFEVLDIRIGGCIQRFRTAIARLRAFERGALSDIEELTCEKLPFLRNEDDEIEGSNNWGRIASACRFV